MHTNYRLLVLIAAPALLISCQPAAGRKATEPAAEVPQGFQYAVGNDKSEKAPDGSLTTSKTYSTKFRPQYFGARGTLALWLKPDRKLRGQGPRVDVLDGDAVRLRIQPKKDAIHIWTHFREAMNGPPQGRNRRPYYFRTLLTHLKGGRWYHVAWTWDASDAARSGFFLDGVRQGVPSAFERPGQLRGAEREVTVRVGAAGFTTGGLTLYGEPLTEAQLRTVCQAAGHRRYSDEGVRFTGEKFLPKDVDWKRPVYETSFADPAVLKDWKLEGGRRISVQGGKLVLESDTKSQRSEGRANHLVAWLTKEVPANFLLEFAVRPQNRQRGLNIVFFNARGLNGENIFQPPIKPRNGLFSQYINGDFNNYHISYWSGGRGTANIRKNKGFALPAMGRDLVYGAAEGSWQTVRIYKKGGTIRLMVDDVVALAYDDDGRTYGPVHAHSGWIGLRQMGHTHRCEYDYLKVWPLKAR